MKQAFTLVETLIVVSIISILAILAIVVLNPQKQINKAWDTQRKHDLATLQKVFEDFYNDKERYPVDADVCYDAKTGPDSDGICTCFICGNESTSPLFKPYMEKLPCDPEHPRKRYLYQYRCASALLGGEYQLNASLSDAISSSHYNYQFGLTSALPTPTVVNPQIPSPTPTSAPTSPPLPTSTPIPTPSYPSCPADPAIKYCSSGITCNVCGSLSNCLAPGNCNQTSPLYTNPSCSNPCSP